MKICIALACAVLVGGCATVYHTTEGHSFPSASVVGATGEARDDAVRASASQDLPCDASSIEVGQMHGQFYAYADGCGKRVTYVLDCKATFGGMDCPLILIAELPLPKH